MSINHHLRGLIPFVVPGHLLGQTHAARSYHGIVQARHPLVRNLTSEGKKETGCGGNQSSSERLIGGLLTKEEGGWQIYLFPGSAFLQGMVSILHLVTRITLILGRDTVRNPHLSHIPWIAPHIGGTLCEFCYCTMLNTLMQS